MYLKHPEQYLTVQKHWKDVNERHPDSRTCFQTALKTPSLCFPLHYNIGKINFFLFIIFPWLTFLNRDGLSEDVLKEAKELEICLAFVHVNLCVPPKLSHISAEGNFVLV